MIEISKEYAAALFELAKETRCEKEIYEGLQNMHTQFCMNPEYYRLLSSPDIPLKERQDLIECAFNSFPEYAVSFVKLLCEKGHILKFPDCVKKYEELHRSLKGISEAVIISAVELTDEEKTVLLQKLEKLSSHTVAAQYEIDESLLGGIMIRMDDRIIDGSLRCKLKELKEVMSQ